MKLHRLALCLPFSGVIAIIYAGPKPISELRKTPEISLGGSMYEDEAKSLYPAHNFSVAIDHFHNESKYEPHTDDKYEMRYWFDDTYYKAGGPVIVLCAGETDGADRLPFLQKGIVYELAKATGGMGVILEHRYYGGSWPTANLSTQSLRFLTTDQALADTAYFAQNIIFPGHENENLTSGNAPWIAYGGSYAGAFVSFLRKLYPETFFGAISSSGVTKAIYDYWEYYEPIRTYAPATCVRNTQFLTHAMDNIITTPGNAALIPGLTSSFGLGGIKHLQDFMQTISGNAIGQWQGRNWDPAVSNPNFDWYCGNVSRNVDMYNSSTELMSTVGGILTVGGYGDQLDTLTNPMLNWIGYNDIILKQQCKQKDVNKCFSSFDKAGYAKDDISQEWRAWPYQYCTEWGYLVTGSGVPKDELPLISRTIDLEYTSMICRDAFNINTPSDVDIINKHGGFDFSYPRLAVINGEADPWRPCTPLAEAARPWPKSTTSEPMVLIHAAVHHWDENGLFPNETKANFPPGPVEKAHAKEEAFVKEWLKEWK